MSRAYSSIAAYAAYLGGGIVLCIAGPSMWNIHPLVAVVAASATTLTFMLLHMLFDTRTLAQRALLNTARRRAELNMLGTYVMKLEQRIAHLGQLEAMPAAENRNDNSAVVTSNLLAFAARVSSRCDTSTTSASSSQAGIDDSKNDVHGMMTKTTSVVDTDLFLLPIASLAHHKTVHYEAIWDRAGAATMHTHASTADTAGNSGEREIGKLAAIISLCGRLSARNPSTRLFCGVSKQALANDGFRKELVDFMRTHAELAGRLVFEIDAATLLSLNAETVADLRELADCGFAFSADRAALADTGKVRSVLGRIGFIKINVSALAAADPNVIAGLAAQNTEIIATDVETEREAELLSALGINLVRGALFGKARMASHAPEQRKLAA